MFQARKIIEEAESRMLGRDPRTGRELNKVPNKQLNTLKAGAKVVGGVMAAMKKGRLAPARKK